MDRSAFRATLASRLGLRSNRHGCGDFGEHQPGSHLGTANLGYVAGSENSGGYHRSHDTDVEFGSGLAPLQADQSVHRRQRSGHHGSRQTRRRFERDKSRTVGGISHPNDRQPGSATQCRSQRRNRVPDDPQS